MRVVGLVVGSKPRKTQGKPKENTPKAPDTKTAPKGVKNK